jgi:ParB-like chromosome segregation protein Spo0J
VEEAEGFRALQERAGMRQTDIAAAVHRSQPTIANAMRVLDLPPAVLDLVRERKLTRGHGVALLRYQGFPEFQAALADHAVTAELKVKDLEGTDVLGHADLRASKTYREVDRYGDRPPYKTICPQCPFGAYLPDKWGGGYCLRPAHYAELGAAARKEQKEALAAALTAAKIDPQQAPSFESLGQGATALKSPGGSTNYYAEEIPAGCSDACPCRVTCTHRGAIVTACRDGGRLRRLQGEARERERKAQEEAAVRRRDAVRRRFAEGTAPKATRLASLLATSLLNAQTFRPLLGVADGVELSDDEIRTALASLRVESVLAYAAQAVLEYAAQDTWRWQHGKVDALAWFFGGDPLHQARTLAEIRAEQQGEGQA